MDKDTLTNKICTEEQRMLDVNRVIEEEKLSKCG